MKSLMIGAAGVALTATAVHAGGIQRTEQSAMVLYETGNLLELSLAYANPELDGENVSPPFPAQDISDVGDGFTLPSFALKYDVTDKVALAFIYDRPYGADISYGDTNVPLGGTVAEANTHALTALMKYNFNDNFSAFGGLRFQQAQGDIHLEGAAYGPVSGYEVNLDKTWGTGYVLGAAYEKREIGLRVALTYNSAITHDMDTTESGPLVDPDGPGPIPAMPLLNATGTTEVKTPESWNLDFQTGVAQDTLVFGSIRYVHHAQFRVDPDRFVAVTGGGLIDLENSTSYTLGVGHRFNEKLSGAVSVTYEAPGDELVSPLAPTTGYTQLRVGGRYDFNEKVSLSGAVSHFWLGDAKPETGTPDMARASFEDNSAWGVGLKLTYRF
ncbi:MAG: transporter [Rhodobacteraceae bacterium]|jgi:long-chain fatty acid transport protein|uniref:Long-chain fatty acid transport protein n=1 Tax=Salipiger profundus TaxID=1229727 RepID=A0A1U7D9S6_9RHOB|nr:MULTISPECIES: outer membrane protein transport protein [Salipiger]APX24815.1 long-chain fatty acid transport protein [Salipiger profundus]MAB07733.1 transporter [Paracoccaceae bacterium]GFZ98025.1 membrane protein [Salipiger profundus]SFC98377.1 Long-chain fatty acid transport protein [Salipiger profundus]